MSDASEILVERLIAWGVDTIFGLPGETSPMAGKPKLNVVHDMYDYPAIGRCSSCGKVMPERQRWITSSTDNLIWFTVQFRLHVEQEHPDWSGTLGNPEQLGDSEAA